MQVTEFRNYSKEYKALLRYWAKKLGATEMVIHEDGSITLTCPDGYICNNYRPTVNELRR